MLLGCTIRIGISHIFFIPYNEVLNKIESYLPKRSNLSISNISNFKALTSKNQLDIHSNDPLKKRKRIVLMHRFNLNYVKAKYSYLQHCIDKLMINQ